MTMAGRKDFLELTEEIAESAAGVADWLRAQQTEGVGLTAARDVGGILDPIEGGVLGEHYAASHFAWAALTLVDLAGRADLVGPAVKAGDFAARHLHGYPGASWAPHYDFNNYALSFASELAKDGAVALRWRDALRSAPTNRHTTANWCAMRGAFLLWRAGVWAGRIDRSLGWTWIGTVLARQTNAGLFEDHLRSSAPPQYHAFTGAVLALLAERRGIRYLDRSVQKAGLLAAQLVDDDGDCLHYGRGQRQLFGYVSFLYLLCACSVRAGSDLTSHIRRVWSLLRSFQRPDGSFPLVLSPFPDHRKVGWYDYNHLTVYNAFAAAWLAQTGRLLAARAGVAHFRARLKRKEPSGNHDPELRLEGGTAIVESDAAGYRVGLQKGRRGYSSEAGIAPFQIWFSRLGPVTGYPGGPEPGRFGDLNPFLLHDRNFFSPMVMVGSTWKAMALGATTLRQLPGARLEAYAKWGGVSLVRRWSFGRTVVVSDTLRFHRPYSKTEVRLVNLPVFVLDRTLQMDHDGAVLQATDGGLRIRIQGSVPLRVTLGERFDWVVGPVQIILAKPPTDLPKGGQVDVSVEFASVHSGTRG